MTTFFPCNQYPTNVMSENWRIENPLWIEILRKERFEPWRYLTMVWWRSWMKRLRPSCELSEERRRMPPRLCQCPPRALRNTSMKFRSGHYLRPILKPINFLALELTSPSPKCENETNFLKDWRVSFMALKTFLKKTPCRFVTIESNCMLFESEIRLQHSWVAVAVVICWPKQMSKFWPTRRRDR